MIEFNGELMESMKKFESAFHDIVPLRMIPDRVSNQELIEAIEQSLAQGKNLLPERFGYAKLGDKIY